MKRAICLSLTIVVLSSSPALSQIGGRAGAFSRLGFGARGMGMGNALTAVTSGDVVSYYNPAVLSQASYRFASASFGILSLDRKLNYVSFTQPVKPSAGIFVGLINSGVSDIDGRDSDGEPTGALRTSENVAFLGFATRFKSGIGIGVNLKLLYYHLYTDVSSTTVSADVGALVPVTESITLGVAIRDINSRYKWDTSPVYGDQNGKTTEDRFPMLIAVGAAYSLPDSLGLISAEIERSNQASLVARFGVEVPVIPELTVRAGVDRIDVRDGGNGVKPTFGFTAEKTLADLTPAINYAFFVEPFSSSPTHVISLSLKF